MSVKVKLVERSMKNGGKSFYIESYVNGKRGYVPVDVRIDPKDDPKTKKEKHQILNAMRSQIELEMLAKGTAYVPSHRKNIDLYDYMQEFLLNYEKKDVKMIYSAIQKFMNFANREVLYVSDFDRKMAEGFRDYLLSREANLSGETPQNYLARFKKVIKAAVRDEILLKSPFDDVIIKKSETHQTLKKNVLTTDEIRKLAKTPSTNEMIKDAFLFSCYTGLGLAEMKIFCKKHIIEGRLKIKRVKTGILIDIPISATALEILSRQTPENGFYFPIDYTTNGVNKNIESWLELAEIKKEITFYCARHTFATQLLKNGADIVSVSKCMGHSSVRYTMKYLNHIEDLKDKAIDNLPKLD